jgi:hypothetical protein
MRDPMRDQVELSQRLAADLGRVRWPAAEELRGIARRRSRRAALAASLAVLLLMSGVGVVATRSFQRPVQPIDLYGAVAAPAPTTIGPQDPAWIPPEALLSPEDIGPGVVTQWTLVDQDQPIGAWALTLASCSNYPRVRTYEGGYLFRRQQTLGYPPKIKGRSGTAVAVLHQTVMRLPGNGALQLVEEAVDAVRVCGSYTGPYPVPGDDPTVSQEVGATHRWTLIDKDFAGDDSLLFEHRRTAVEAKGKTGLGASAVLVIRIGDLVTTVEQVDSDNPGSARKLGTRAAAWLCAAATSPC